MSNKDVKLHLSITSLSAYDNREINDHGHGNRSRDWSTPSCACKTTNVHRQFPHLFDISNQNKINLKQRSIKTSTISRNHIKDPYQKSKIHIEKSYQRPISNIKAPYWKSKTHNASNIKAPYRKSKHHIKKSYQKPITQAIKNP